MKFKPTSEQIAIIKQCAVIEAQSAGYRGSSPNGLILEPGVRYNREGLRPGTHINIAMVAADPSNWDDTDLSDYGSWAEFRKGTELTDDDRGIFDFYISKRGLDTDLLSNITVTVISGQMHHIDGVGRSKPIWCATGGFS